VLPASRQQLLELVPDDASVLDVGAWAWPLARADWVLDLMPHATRGLYGEPDPDPERFSEDTWVVRDICDREPWPFADNEFDFVVCAHTLEDIRDPLWVCSELQRVAPAGYIEVPSRLQEQAYGVHGDWIGWSHHRWLIEVSDDAIEFVFKPHLLGEPGNHFAPGFAQTLTPEQRVQTLWWEDAFQASERIFLDDTLNDYLREFVSAHPQPPQAQSRRASLRGRIGRAGR
jgi:hypothetical protein